MARNTHAALLAILALRLVGGENECRRDGLLVDFNSGCEQYYRCAGGRVVARYSCSGGRKFSEAAGGCIPQAKDACVRRSCAAGDTRAYASPYTACSHYYRCQNGTAEERACPPGAWFDFERQSCTYGAGVCFDPVCAGRMDGTYPDSTHDCVRAIQCAGAKLAGVTTCVGATCRQQCPRPRDEAVGVPVGDASFCAEAACRSLCEAAGDGAHADRATGCREYFVCAGRRVVRRGRCEPGALFDGGACVPAAAARCPAPARSPCFNRADGLHRDWRSCSAWMECRRERVVSHGECGEGLVFDGGRCVPPQHFYCEGPRPAAECEGQPSGVYQELESNCTRYYRCEGALRTTLACGAGQVHDGEGCVPRRAYQCPSLALESCQHRADGLYPAPDAGCRAYFSCAAGHKANHACKPGQAFVPGEGCRPETHDNCPDKNRACAQLADGYHADLTDNCRSYFYCHAGDRLGRFNCHGEKMFDGSSCVEPSTFTCGAPAEINTTCERDGFTAIPGTGCKRYVMCIRGLRSVLSCPQGQLFNGSLCVPAELHNCPG